MKFAKVLIPVLIAIVSILGKNYYAPGWSATRSPAIGCQYVQISGQVVSGDLIVEIQDSSTYQWIYADEVPGNYFASVQNIDLGTCVLYINLYVFPPSNPPQYLILAHSLQIPLQLDKPRQPTG